MCLDTGEKYRWWCGRIYFKPCSLKHQDIQSAAHQRKCSKFLAKSLATHVQIHKKTASKNQGHEGLSLGFGTITMKCSPCICPQVNLALLTAVPCKLSSILQSHVFKHFRMAWSVGFFTAWLHRLGVITAWSTSTSSIPTDTGYPVMLWTPGV